MSQPSEPREIRAARDAQVREELKLLRERDDQQGRDQQQRQEAHR